MSSMTSPFGGPTGTFAQQSQNQPQPTNTMQQPFGGQNGQPKQGGLAGMFGGFGGQQGGFGMPQMQSPYGPQQGGFGGGFGDMGGGFQNPYGPQQGGFGGYGQQMGGFGGGMMGGGFNPYQQQGYGGGFGGFGGGMMGGGYGGGFGGGFNPYQQQMQSPYGPQMGGYGGGFGGGFGGGMGGFGRGRGMGRGMGGNQGMLSDMQYRGDDFDDMSHALPPSYRGGPDPRMRADMPRQLGGTPRSPEDMPPQYQNNMLPDNNAYSAIPNTQRRAPSYDVPSMFSMMRQMG